MAARQPPQHGSRSDHAPRRAGSIRRVPAAHHTRDSSRAAGTRHGRIVGAIPKAGRRVVGVPDAIIPALSEHLAVSVKDEPGALVFPGARGGPLRRGNFNKMSALPYAVESIGVGGSALPRFPPHRKPVRGQERCRAPGPDGPHRPRQRAGRDDHQHDARGADQLITNAIDAHLQGEQRKYDDDGSAGALIPAG